MIAPASQRGTSTTPSGTGASNYPRVATRARWVDAMHRASPATSIKQAREPVMRNAGSAPKPRRLHESVVEVMADAVIGTDTEYCVTVWNPAAERLYGYSAAEAIGRPA